MASDDSDGFQLASPTLRFLAGLPVAPAFFSLAVFLIGSGAFLLAEVWSGRLAWLAASGEDGLRNVRLAVGFMAMSAYLPTATLYVVQGARRTADALRPQLRLEDADLRARVEAIGTPPATGFRWAGAIGVFVALMIPLLVDLPRGEFSYTLDQPLETIWHRIATPIVGWWGGRLGYVILLESRRLSELASGLQPIDLFDLESLLPFARLGLTHALLLIGFVSIFVVMSFFEVGFGLAVGLITSVSLPAAFFSMLLPVRGVHQVIRDEKRRRLERCGEQLRAFHAATATGRGDVPTGELADVLTLRAHLEAVREWPFDSSVLVRFAVYLVIPIGSWAGAALVERVVNAFLD